MINTIYTTAIEVAKAPADAFKRIIDLPAWWVEEFAGEKPAPGAAFILKIGDDHFSKNKVIEFVPGRRFVWVTTESRRSSDDFDWTGTKMIFDLCPSNAGTRITFTYDGVVLEHQQEQLKEICNYCIGNLLYYHLESFTTSIDISGSPLEVFTVITRDVSKWWGGKDLRGSHSLLNDEFVVHHPAAHYSKQKLIEVVAGKKVAWLVTESTLYWLQHDKQEWTDTKMIFEISNGAGKTTLHFTHYGLVPAKECFKKCKEGWTNVIEDWLFHYITEGKVNERFL